TGSSATGSSATGSGSASAAGLVSGSSAAGSSAAGAASATGSSTVSASSGTSGVSSSVFFLRSAIYFLSSDAARSLRRVRIRAISRFARRRRALFSSAPVAAWKRRLKSSWRVSWSRRWSSSSVISLSCLAFKEVRLPLHDLRRDRQLVAGQPQCLLRQRLGHAGELEHHPAGLDDRDPALRRPL